MCIFEFFFSSRRRHTRWPRDWSSDVCSSDLVLEDFVAEGGIDEKEFEEGATAVEAGAKTFWAADGGKDAVDLWAEAAEADAVIGSGDVGAFAGDRKSVV